MVSPLRVGWMGRGGWWMGEWGMKWESKSGNEEGGRGRR